MRPKYILYYILMTVLNILPFIPLSIKGILGFAFIIISCVHYGYREGLYTASLWVVLGFINFMLDINVDYKYGIVDMLLGTLLYYVTAFFFGRTTDALKTKNRELTVEVDKRKATEEELKEKLNMLQGLMDTIPAPIFFKDMELRYTGCNHEFERVLGISEGEILGKSVYDLFEKDLADAYSQKDLELLENMGNQKYEGEARNSQGILKEFIFNKAILKSCSGQPTGIIGVVTDITERREQERLKKSIHDIMEYDKAQTEFFSNISHELRTPLNVILGSIQLMEIYTKDEVYAGNKDKVVKSTAVMKQNCYRLLRLVNNLIDITRIDSRALELQLKNHNIISVVEEITLSVSDYIENKGIKLVFDTDVEEKILACDDDKIERIILNLLSNAIKYTPEGGTISVAVLDRGNGIQVKISDTGIGIPADKQGEIFQRFCQISETFTRQREGSGIGLNLVKSLVELHGGSITVQSCEGEGSTFTIELPVVLVSDEYICSKPLVKQAHVERINVEFSDIYCVS